MTASSSALELAQIAVTAADDKLADDIVVIDVSDHLFITDAFVIASGNSERQVGAIVNGIEKVMHEQKVRAIRREGEREGRWVLLDYGDIIVHVQHVEDREFYALERLWRDCPFVSLPLESGAQTRGPAKSAANASA